MPREVFVDSGAWIAVTIASDCYHLRAIETYRRLLLGSDTLVHFQLGGDVLTARMPPDVRTHAGEEIRIGVDPSKVHLFDAATQRAIA